MGLEYATAPWIWFQDDDDTLYDNNSLENLLTIVESQGGVEEVALVSGSKQAVFVAEHRTQREHCIGSVQGTLYNRALLKERGVHFEPLLTWKEEDTAFLTLVICATLDKKQIDYFQPVYIKYWTPGVRSVTTRVDAVNSVYNLLAAKSYCLFYHLKYKFVDIDQPDTTDYYIMIPTFIHNLVTVCQKYKMTITSEMYQTIPQFIQYYFDFIKMITSRGWVPKNFDKAKIA